MPSFGNMFASLTLESASFMSGLDAARKSLGNTQKTFERIGRSMQGVGAMMTVGITAPFIAMTNSAMEGALAQRQAMAQVNAALSSMGPVAGKTADQLSRAADALEMRSMVDADVILTKVTANLLTFGNVAGQVFDRAQQAALDMAQRMGGDVQAATMLVGKALNDPIKGLTALSRVGIQFTAQQKEQIKTMAAAGNMAGAQGIILGELERQFGGAAAAAAQTDPYRQMNVAFGQMADVLGEVALNVLPPVTTAIKGIAEAFLALPQPVQTGLIAVIAVGAALGPVIAAAGTLVTGIGAILPVLAALKVAIMTQAIPAIASFVVATAPISVPIIAIAAAIGAVVYAVKNWDQIKPYVDKVLSWMTGLYTGVKKWIVDKLGKVWEWVVSKVGWVSDAFFKLYDAVVGHSYIPDMVDEIGGHMARLEQTLVAPAAKATSKAAQAFLELQQKVAPILDRLFPQQAREITFAKELALIEANAKQAGWTVEHTAEAIRRLRDEYAKDGGTAPGSTGDDIIRQNPGGLNIPNIDIPEMIEDMGDALPDFSKVARKTAGEVVQSFADMARDVAGSIRNLSSSLKSKDWLSAIQDVADIFAQLAKAGVFGSGMQGRASGDWSMSNWGGARALGGPVLPNRSYLVGERGPEILRMGGRGGSIVPNDQIGGPMSITVAVEEGALFRPIVRSEAGQVSYQAVGSNNRTMALRQRQALA